MKTNNEKALKLLKQMEQDLSQRLEKLSADLAQSHSADWAEQAVERENDEVMEQLRDDTSSELTQVKHAIKRIDDGSYNRCAKCGETISPERLEALPYSVYCIACANE